MTWELQGNVRLDNIDADVAALPLTEGTDPAETGQNEQVRVAIAQLLHSAEIGGPVVFVRAGGHGNPSHVNDADSPALECMTLTLEPRPDAPVDIVVQGDSASEAASPVEA